MESAVWGLLGTLVGASASIVASLITSRSSVRLQANAASRELLDKHRAMQMQTLLELQEAVNKEMRAAAKANIADEMEFRRSGEWTRPLLGEALNQENFEAGRRTAFLVERVADDALRAQVNATRESCTAVLLARSRSAADVALKQMTERGMKAQQDLGVVLRRLYASPPSE
ncbi:hypothetical protein [Variovorax sp. PBL-E5]|uniref:hypothetical protein n=1 Tax=Variovorax sp. PBL-E5 TaxID=434014 RepID=UPI00131772E7|nr:hypothetical protein [Variovorax sp. PBL-E5]VTU29927.1 hypothetical protein E5CHR_02910 [Variovorax sp. PBL-E5]